MTELTTGAVRPQALFCEPRDHRHLRRSRSEDFSAAALRFFAVAVGVTVLAASTNAVIDAAHLAGADAHLVQALAAGVAAGAVIAPRARFGLAALIIAALVAGEAYNLLATAERIVTQRAATASTISGANGRHTVAGERLARAEVALAAHRDRAAVTVATPACRAECRALLQSQEAGLAAEVEAARNALEAAPPARSATPLADRLGMPAWALDLLAAGLLSIGANGLAASLIAWGARPAGTRRQPAPIVIEAVNGTQAAASAVPACPEVTAFTNSTVPDDEPPQPPKGGLPVSPRTRGVLALIEAAGGTVAGSQRDLAERAGISKTALGRALAALEAEGVVEIDADKMRGTRVSLRIAA